MNRTLDIALAKVRPFSDTREWCAALTPAEIIALIDDGHKPASNNDWVVERARECLKTGEGGTRWFYFLPTGKHVPKYQKAKAHDKRQLQ